MRISTGVVSMLCAAMAAACNSSDPSSAPTTPAMDLYVSLPAADSIARVDPAAGKLLGKTTVGSLPHHFLRHPDGLRLYVVLVGSQAVAEIDLRTGAVTRTLRTEAVPLTRDDGTIIQTHIDRHADAHTTCYDCHNPAVDGARPVVVGSRPFGIAFNANATALYVTNMRTRSLVTLDLASGEMTDRMPLAPSGDAYEPTGVARVNDQLYVALRPQIPSDQAGALRRIATATRTTTADAANGPNTSVVVADDRNRRLYVNNFESNTVTAYGVNGEVLASYPVGPGPLGLRLLNGGATLLAANYYDNSISLVNTASGESQMLPLTVGDRFFPNPTFSEIDPGTGKWYVVSSGTRGHVLTFDPNTKQFTTAIEIGGLPFDVTAVPKRSE